jgi:hypothetical protein
MREKKRCLLERVYVDKVGPSDVDGIMGERYFYGFTDDYSGYTKVYPTKDGTADTMKKLCIQYKMEAELETGMSIKEFYFDMGTEMNAKEVQTYLTDAKITYQYANTATPQQIGTQERKNGILINVARCALYEEKVMSCSFWAEAIKWAAETVNAWPRSSNVDQIPPYELWHSKMMDYKKLRVFGCVAYVLARLPNRHRGKWMPNAVKCIFVKMVTDSTVQKEKFLLIQDTWLLMNLKFIIWPLKLIVDLKNRFRLNQIIKWQ